MTSALDLVKAYTEELPTLASPEQIGTDPIITVDPVDGQFTTRSKFSGSLDEAGSVEIAALYVPTDSDVVEWTFDVAADVRPRQKGRPLPVRLSKDRSMVIFELEDEEQNALMIVHVRQPKAELKTVTAVLS